MFSIFLQRSALAALLMFCSVPGTAVLAQQQGTVSQLNTAILVDSLNNKSFKKKWENAEACCSHSINFIEKSKSGIGRDAVRFQVSKKDPMVNNGYRSELRMPKEKDPNAERWYRFSIYLPKGYAVDSTAEILAQWHEVPDFSLGEKYRTPPIALQIDKKNWRVNVWSTSLQVNTDKQIKLKKTFELGTFTEGAWTEFLFHIKFSYKEDGILQIWKNNKLMTDYKGPNYYNDRVGPFFKLGVYKVSWKLYKDNSILSDRLLYFSNVKVGNERSTFQTMMK